MKVKIFRFVLGIFFIVVILNVDFIAPFLFRANKAIIVHKKYQSQFLLRERKGPADNDFISSFFSKFLPTPEDIGLTRYNQTTRPENYPCVKNEFASLIPEDKGRNVDPDIAVIRQLLAKTNLESRPLQLLYNAKNDGWNPSSFHSKVDRKGPCVVLARSASGGIFGGYNPTGWVNLGEYRGSIAAFLFVFPNNNIQSLPIKLAKIAGAGLAQIDDGYGPKFGTEGLTIPLTNPNPKSVRCKLGLYYERLPNGEQSILPGNKAIDELVDLKVFAGVYAPGERIPYSDALPFSLN